MQQTPVDTPGFVFYCGWLYISQVAGNKSLVLGVGKHAPVAQRIRASDYGSEGCRFESCLAHRQARSISSALFCMFVFYNSFGVRSDLPERCDLARDGTSERRACLRLKARGAFNASEVCLRLC